MDKGLASLKRGAALSARRTTPDHIAESLREAILGGRFQDGEVLSQVALAGHYGVSRVPVREALRQLHAEGLITVEAHHRVRVSVLTIERIREIFEIRTLLESHLLREAFPRIDAALIGRLEKLLDEMETVRQHRPWLQKNREFHSALYEPSGAQLTIGLVGQLASRNERYLQLWSSGRGVERSKEAQAEHRAILTALRRRDLRLARAELERHIARTREQVERLAAARLVAV